MTSSALMSSSTSWWGSFAKKEHSVCHELLCRLSQSPSLLISGSGSGPQPEAPAQSLAHFAFPLVMRRSIGHFPVPKTLTFKMWLGAQLKMSFICTRMKNDFHISTLQNSPYFCVFKYARAVKQKVLCSLLYQRLSTYSRFETEARGNSEIAYSNLQHPR